MFTVKIKVKKLKKLKKLSVKFKETIINKTIKEVKDWKVQQNNKLRKNKSKENENKDEETVIFWATQFKTILKLNPLERKLVPKAGITFAKPPTLAQHLLNYKIISKGEEKVKTNSRCMRCGLCGNFKDLENMVKDETKIKIKNENHFTSTVN